MVVSYDEKLQPFECPVDFLFGNYDKKSACCAERVLDLVSYFAQHNNQRERAGAQREPNGSQREPNGRQ